MTLETATVMVSNSIVTICIWSIGVCGNILYSEKQFSEAFMCVELTTVGALSGLGRTRLCSIISIAFTSARIPLSIILGGIMGLDGIWWAISSTSIVKGIIFTCTFLWITRKRR